MPQRRTMTSYEQLQAENAVLREALMELGNYIRSTVDLYRLQGYSESAVAGFLIPISIGYVQGLLKALDYNAMGEEVEVETSDERIQKLEIELAVAQAQAEILKDINNRVLDSYERNIDKVLSRLDLSEPVEQPEVDMAALVRGLSKIEAAYPLGKASLISKSDLHLIEENFASPSDETVARPAVMTANNFPNNENCPFEHRQRVRLAVDYPFQATFSRIPLGSTGRVVRNEGQPAGVRFDFPDDAVVHVRWNDVWVTDLCEAVWG